MARAVKAPRKRNLPHLAARLFATPLLIDARKLDMIVPVFMRKLNGDEDDSPDDGDYRENGEPQIDTSTGVAIIPVIGSLIRRPSMMDWFSGLTSYGDIAKSLDCALDDARVRAILLQVDSFGGEAGGCFELCDKIFQARTRGKPIWASADIDALSAGYAIACSAERLFVAPRGSAGSVGVVSLHVERSEMNEAMGITYTVFRAGDRKADMNPFEKLTAEAAQKQLDSMERTRQEFASLVARNRGKVSVQEVLDTEGQWYDADDSVSVGFADEKQPFEVVLNLLTEQVAARSVATTPPATVPAPVEQVPDDDPAQPDPTAPSVQRGDDKMKTPEQAAATVDPKTVVADAAAGGPEAAALAAATAAPPQTQPVVTPPATATSDDGKVVHLGGGRITETAAHEIAELCEVAGKPELAGRFIMEKLSVADVRKKLLESRAEASAAAEISNHQPDLKIYMPKPHTAAAVDSWDDAFKRAQSMNPNFRS